ncbi:hypothetical protein K440DRAFT_475135, partial [Wilcoxina mikolae CBS 423.85]
TLIILIFHGVAVADDGDDSTNNLFSDLAPVIALFGEQFAKQFLSESMGWLDHIIFAMAPLGIITAIIGAIRVGGPTWLRAVIGRARENRAAAEIELMSSTSHEVGEVWNGQAIVRTLGKPEVQQIIYLASKYDTETFGLYTVEMAEEHNRLWPGKIYRRNPPKSAPNISLNLHGGSKPNELFIVALSGILLQIGVLVFAGFTVYHPVFKLRFPKKGRPVAAYAYPLLNVGTVILASGMMICSRSKRGRDQESLSQREPDRQRLQKSHVVSDQTFDSFIIFSKHLHDKILTSRRSLEEPKTIPHQPGNAQPKLWIQSLASSKSEAFTLLGTFIALAGFVLQFQALRGLNWSISVAQMVAICFMTMLRAWVRRGLAMKPVP